MKGIIRKLRTPTTPPEETTPLEEETLKTYASLFREQCEGTLYMGSKEASGYPQLADYLLCMRSRLHKLRPEVTLHIDPQYAIQGNGKQFYADGSLLATILHNTRPVYVVEYKPRVPTHLEDREPTHLSELFLQAFYLHKQNSPPILHVLTDLTDFHCFLMKQGQLMKYFYYLS